MMKQNMDKKSPDSIFYKHLSVPSPRTKLATTRDRELVPAGASQTGPS